MAYYLWLIFMLVHGPAAIELFISVLGGHNIVFFSFLLRNRNSLETVAQGIRFGLFRLFGCKISHNVHSVKKRIEAIYKNPKNQHEMLLEQVVSNIEDTLFYEKIRSFKFCNVQITHSTSIRHSSFIIQMFTICQMLDIICSFVALLVKLAARPM